jgi:xanthine dehydrogenase YagS FAD-binding subunit
MNPFSLPPPTAPRTPCRRSRRRASRRLPRRRHHPGRPHEARRDDARHGGRHQRAAAVAASRSLPGGGLRIGALARNSDVAATKRSPPLSGARRGAALRRQPADPQHGERRRQPAAAHPLRLLPRHRRACNKRSPAPAARRSAATTAATRCSAPATAASPRSPATCRWPWRRSTPWCTPAAPAAASAPSRIAEFHLAYGDDPARETVLEHGELITAVDLPAVPWFARSTYVKVRDRASYEFALASAAVALDLDGGGRIRAARVALGGVATRPWRSPEAERGARPAPGRAAGLRRRGGARRRSAGQRPELARRTTPSRSTWRSRTLPPATTRPRRRRRAKAGAYAMTVAVGKPLDRTDGRPKITGAARYAADFPAAPPGARRARARHHRARQICCRSTPPPAQRARGARHPHPRECAALARSESRRARTRRPSIRARTWCRSPAPPSTSPARTSPWWWQRPWIRRATPPPSCVRYRQERCRCSTSRPAAQSPGKPDLAAQAAGPRRQAPAHRGDVAAALAAPGLVKVRQVYTSSRSKPTIRWSRRPPWRSGTATASPCGTRRNPWSRPATSSPRPSACRATTCGWSARSPAAASAARASNGSTPCSPRWRRAALGRPVQLNLTRCADVHLGRPSAADHPDADLAARRDGTLPPWSTTPSTPPRRSPSSAPPAAP